jgi:hypothetical protein
MKKNSGQVSGVRFQVSGNVLRVARCGFRAFAAPRAAQALAPHEGATAPQAGCGLKSSSYSTPHRLILRKFPFFSYENKDDDDASSEIRNLKSKIE